MSYSFRSTAAALAAVTLVSSGAYAESLSDRRAARDKVVETTVEAACGVAAHGDKPGKENCDIVVPEVTARSVPNHVRLTGLESKGSVESTKGLCDGDVNLAFVQADVFKKLSETESCTGKLVVLGNRPLYPYVGFMVVRGDAKSDTFQGLIDALPEGKTLHIAAGGGGSGGEYTLRTILNSNPDWKNRVTIESDGQDTALPKLQDRAIDAFFVMDGPKSPLLSMVKEEVDEKTKAPTYKFVDFRPTSKVTALTYNDGKQQLYSTTVIAGYWNPTKTIETPAIMVVRNDWYQANATLTGIIRQAADDAGPNIAARAGARPDWYKDFGLR